MEDLKAKALEIHSKNKGKIAMVSKVAVNNAEDLSLVYTPGVAEPCKLIAKDSELVYEYTSKSKIVAVVTDGSAVLGLGNIGAKASLPVMEGKSILFKEFAGVDSFPICLETQDTEEIINIVKNIGASFGGINLEDINAPKCIEIETRLKEIMDIPVFHDDQHGTAIVVAAALINAAKVANKNISDLVVAQSGTGAAGINVVKMIKALGAKEIRAYNINGVVNSATRSKNDKYVNKLLDKNIVVDFEKTKLEDIFENADVFVGVSAANIVTEEMVKKMNDKAIIFAMANPIPEIMPDIAKKAGVFIIGTGRSDFPNQINNVLAFPGIFKGALQVRKQITDEMKMTAARAIASCVSDEELSVDKIIPNPFDKRVAQVVAEAVILEANKSK